MTEPVTIEKAREIIAARATAAGEHMFAREVLAGCWDHRRDVQAALAGRPPLPAGHPLNQSSQPPAHRGQPARSPEPETVAGLKA